MVMPFTKIWFIVDAYSDSRLTQERCFAEYDLLKRKIIWKQWSNEAENQNMSIAGKILGLAPLASPFLIVPLINLLGGYSKYTATPQQRIGSYAVIFPIILGFLIFFSLEYFMLYLRRNQKCIREPSVEEQIAYFESIFENTIRHNNTVGVYKTPYLVTVVTCVLTICGIIPLMFWVYNQQDTFGTFIAKMSVLGLLLSIIPYTIWYLIVRGTLMKKIVKNLKKGI